MIGLVFGLFRWVATAFIAIILLALLISFVLYVGDNPNSSGNAVEGFFGEVIDTIKGWLEFGKEIAD